MRPVADAKMVTLDTKMITLGIFNFVSHLQMKPTACVLLFSSLHELIISEKPQQLYKE